MIYLKEDLKYHVLCLKKNQETCETAIFTAHAIILFQQASVISHTMVTLKHDFHHKNMVVGINMYVKPFEHGGCIFTL